MTFRVGDLEPTKVLAERVAIIRQHFPDFFQGDRLLDVGCAQGWFSLAHQDCFRKIVAIDGDSQNIEICHGLALSNRIEFQEVSFRDFWSHEPFDKIYMGNVAHHVFREIESHDWIAKLAALSLGDVLIEGPKTTACLDLKREGYSKTFDTFCNRMETHFDLVREAPAVSYTPDRYVMLWRRRVPNARAEEEIEKSYHEDKYTRSTPVSVFLAATSPASNGLLRLTEGGWVEAFCHEKPFKYFENEAAIFERHCKHNAYLARLGYVDIDPGTINFFRGSLKLFDKGAVMPIALLEDIHVAAYRKLFEQSYRHIPKSVLGYIWADLPAIASSTNLQAAFEVVAGAFVLAADPCI
jgi:hypothetical protein